jgi:hypothetical protein
VGFDYDRRRVAGDSTAAPKPGAKRVATEDTSAKRPPPQMRPVGHNEKAEALHDLERTLSHLAMWAGRARMALDPAHNTEGFRSQFKSTPKELTELTKLRDELQGFVEKVRHLEAE